MCDCPEIQRQKFKGNEFSISYKNPDIWIEHEGNFLYARHDIWLPRQDQIQEMMIKDSINIELNKFYVFCLEKDYIGSSLPTAEFDSFEQLWLAFYMYEKHGKVWNEDKWIKK